MAEMERMLDKHFVDEKSIAIKFIKVNCYNY